MSFEYMHIAISPPCTLITNKDFRDTVDEGGEFYFPNSPNFLF